MIFDIPNNTDVEISLRMKRTTLPFSHRTKPKQQYLLTGPVLLVFALSVNAYLQSDSSKRKLIVWDSNSNCFKCVDQMPINL